MFLQLGDDVSGLQEDGEIPAGVSADAAQSLPGLAVLEEEVERPGVDLGDDEGDQAGPVQAADLGADSGLTGHTARDDLLDLCCRVLENYSQALALNIRFEVKDLPEGSPAYDYLGVKISRLEFDQFAELSTGADENPTDGDDLVPDVEGVVEDRVVPLFPADHPDTAEEVDQGEGALDVFLPELEPDPGRVTDLLPQSHHLLLPVRPGGSSLLRCDGRQGDPGRHGELTGEAGQGDHGREGRPAWWRMVEAGQGMVGRRSDPGWQLVDVPGRTAQTGGSRLSSLVTGPGLGRTARDGAQTPV